MTCYNDPYEGVEAYLEVHEDAEFITTTLNIKEIAVGRALQDEFSTADIRSAFDWMRIVPFEINASFTAGELEAAFHRYKGADQDK